MSGHSREETMAFDDPKQVMQDFAVWVNERSKRRPLFISDNNGFDWQFINWYFWHFTDGNPFGHTSTNSSAPSTRGWCRTPSRTSNT